MHNDKSLKLPLLGKFSASSYMCVNCVELVEKTCSVRLTLEAAVSGAIMIAVFSRTHHSP